MRVLYRKKGECIQKRGEYCGMPIIKKQSADPVDHYDYKKIGNYRQTPANIKHAVVCRNMSFENSISELTYPF